MKKIVSGFVGFAMALGMSACASDPEPVATETTDKSQEATRILASSWNSLSEEDQQGSCEGYALIPDEFTELMVEGHEETVTTWDAKEFMDMVC